ncbi:MAG: phosphoglycerate kinase [Gemmatimonadetes bacterium]|nr:phosphoglycerate kinase [Gemmatimonadota bacterium]NNL31157.1 phosphoglycerate kinase [Gemmatimonadota bacterium]
MIKKSLTDLEPARLEGRTVLVRADLNVPLDDDDVSDDQRIRASLPTLRILCDAGAKVVLLSHLGRPKGRAQPEFSLAPVARRLGDLLEYPVRFVGETHGEAVAHAVADTAMGQVVLLENTRFHPGETENDPELSASWADLGDIFVNDAFGTAHRAHASTAGLAQAMRSRGHEAVAGILMARELRYLEGVLRMPERPFLAIIGGAKISTKIGVISALLPLVDRLLIGGAMANTFFRALGLDTGESLVEEDAIDLARELVEEGGETIVLPVDCVVAPEVHEGAPARIVDRDAVKGVDKIVDIGPRTRSRFADMIGEARVIFWNGPMGVFEMAPFAQGTISVAEAVADACDSGAMGVLGGGDSAAAAQQAGVAHRLTHVSTGGGASLELIAGAELPGVASLSGVENE